ncbi:hypothetical protein CBR_g985 [Chara braunii]|uniref:Rhodanese domain-containing protein n=1 Tax=Chara braunii TaxID=69332 RepID=A0A388KCY2_CHABU|nr:hypothetical protein CBR_g985 [Chara braunii]|eukprot:GBG67866.1 hypothetical protein CBR_g985 [Chara braunii]
MEKTETNTDTREGVLLYYKYVAIPTEDLQGVCDWMGDLCSSLGLRGRIRVAPDGINVTIGICQRPINSIVQAECGFQNLSVRIAKELVTLGLGQIEEEADLKNSGIPLSPEEFQKMLEDAASSSAHMDGGSTVTVDDGHCSSLSTEKTKDDEQCCPSVINATLPQLERQGSSALKGTRADTGLLQGDFECHPASILRNGDEEYDESAVVFDQPKLCRAMSSPPPDDSELGENEWRRLHGSVAHDENGTSVNHGGASSCTTCESSASPERGLPAAGAGGNAIVEQRDSKETVVLDVRNIYETRIGRFVPPPGVQFVDPQIRQFSDLPTWLDANEESLRGRRVMMYCTGGVRCERASAYLRSKGKDFQDVVQLRGGIHRYLESFPDGKFFSGKNFVFDHRVSVPSAHPTTVIGRCLECHSPYDDYSARCRCTTCRLLILICPDCQKRIEEEGSKSSKFVCELCRSKRHEGQQGDSMCRIQKGNGSCPSRGKSKSDSVQSALLRNETDEKREKKNPGRRKRKEDRKQLFRAACADGFHQSSISDGPTKDRLEAEQEEATPSWIFDDTEREENTMTEATEQNSICAGGKTVQSDHVGQPGVQLHGRERENVGADECPTDGVRDLRNCGGDSGMIPSLSGGFPFRSASLDSNDDYEHKKELEGEVNETTGIRLLTTAESHQHRLRILCLHGFRQNASSLQGRFAALRKKLRSIVDMVFVDAPHELPPIVVTNDDNPHAERVEGNPPTDGGIEIDKRSDRVVHLAPKPRYAWLIGCDTGESSQRGPVGSGKQFDAQQYKSQRDGWSSSFSHLAAICQQKGPFDGVLGFSQGAAVAAVLCALQMRNEQQKYSSADCERRPRFSELSPESLESQGKNLSAKHLSASPGLEGKDSSANNCIAKETSTAADAHITIHPCNGPPQKQQDRGGGVPEDCSSHSSAVAAAVSCHHVEDVSTAAAGSPSLAAAIHSPDDQRAIELDVVEPSRSLNLPDAHNPNRPHHHMGAFRTRSLVSERAAVRSPFDFRFVVLCSGFLSPAPEHVQLLRWAESKGGINIPSLHIFGGQEGSDRQISETESDRLAALFLQTQRKVVCHGFGHIVPSQREFVNQYVSFFKQFL